MNASHTTISVDKPEGKRFRAAKPDSMSSTRFLRELLDQYEADDTDGEDSVSNEDLRNEIRRIPEKTADQFDRGY